MTEPSTTAPDHTTAAPDGTTAAHDTANETETGALPDAPHSTLVCVVLDRSGSMQAIKSDVDGGFDAFIAAALTRAEGRNPHLPDITSS